MSELETLRKEIDRIDNQLLTLLKQRLEAVSHVADYKGKHNLTIYDPKREKVIYQKLQDLAIELSLPQEMVKHIYQQILNESKKYQKRLLSSDLPVQIGIQGGAGSFNHQAIDYYLSQKNELTGSSVQYLYTVENVFKALESGEIDYGQFAVYNSLGGLVGESLAQIGEHHFIIEDSYQIQIAHFLMIHSDSRLDQIDTIMGHEQVLKQCKANLQKRYPHLKLVPGHGDFIDNTSIAEGIARRTLPITTACLAGKQLADIFDLKIVDENLQDHDQNFTTFLLVSK
jgi:chorismate mutase/prephenate dehydratase